MGSVGLVGIGGIGESGGIDESGGIGGMDWWDSLNAYRILIYLLKQSMFFRLTQ